MLRRRFVGATLMAVAAPALRGQSLQRSFRIAVIGRNALAKPWPPVVTDDAPEGWWDFEKYQERLAEMGIVAGRNLELRGYLPRSTARSDIEASVRQAIAWNPDVIKVFSTADTLIVRSLTSDIPIVFSRVDDPISSGLVSSMARPGANVTGVSGNTEEIVAKQLEIAAALASKTRRIAVVFDTRSLPGSAGGLQKLRRVASERKLRIVELDISKYKNDIQGALESISRGQVDAALEFGFLQTHVPENAYRDFQERTGVPYIADSAGAAKNLGAVVGLGPNHLEQIRAAADLSARILRGTKPADLPVFAATTYLMTINRRIAKQCGIAIPVSIIIQADSIVD